LSDVLSFLAFQAGFNARRFSFLPNLIIVVLFIVVDERLDI